MALENNEVQISHPICEARWANYGIEYDTWRQYNLRDITQEEAARKGFSNASDGIYIPYPRDEDSRVRWHRTGFAVQTVAGKYGQRAGTLPAMYVPPTLDKSWRTRADLPVLITEGEFKAIIVDLLVNSETATKIVPVAVSGVFNWQSAKNGIDLIEDFKRVSWAGRMVYMAFDMDQNTNPMVCLALQRLVNKLGEHGAVCRVLQWNGDEGKGIDDYLTKEMLPRDAWLNLIENAQFAGHIESVIELNARYTYCEVQQQVYDSQNSTYIPPKSFSSDFFTRKIKVQAGVKNGIAVMKEHPIGSYWLSSPLRATCIEPCFQPGKPRLVEMDGNKYLNTWGGWGMGLRTKPLAPLKGAVKPFYEFLHATFGGEDPKHVEYLIKRLAWMFQQPEKKHPTWLYMLGRPYQGKSALIKIISSLVGERYTANVDESIVKGQFAEWRSEKLFVTFDDSSITDPRVIRQLLKRLTTESSSQVNLKYVKAQTTESYFSFAFATNSVDPLLDHDDRRALVLEADCKWDYAKGEWKEFDVWRNSRANLAGLLHHLMYEVKIDSDFYSEAPPKTLARELVIEVGESTWDDLINFIATTRGKLSWPLPATGNMRDWKPTVFTVDMVRNIFLLKNGETEKYRISSATLVGKLTRYGARRCTPKEGTDSRKRININGEQVSFWTWDYQWMARDREQLLDEYMHMRRDMPELFPQRAGSKF